MFTIPLQVGIESSPKSACPQIFLDVRGAGHGGAADIVFEAWDKGELTTYAAGWWWWLISYNDWAISIEG